MAKLTFTSGKGVWRLLAALAFWKRGQFKVPINVVPGYLAVQDKLPENAFILRTDYCKFLMYSPPWSGAKSARLKVTLKPEVQNWLTEMNYETVFWLFTDQSCISTGIEFRNVQEATAFKLVWSEAIHE